MNYKDFVKKILSDEIVSPDEHNKMKEYEKEILDIDMIKNAGKDLD